jgi:SWI/SNF-related matrix-associated actin-dependent regulator 1 of chromatin subfamily A
MRLLILSANNNCRCILEHILETLHLGFIRLDGRMNIEDRQSVVDAFHERTDNPVFLLSTRPVVRELV